MKKSFLRNKKAVGVAVVLGTLLVVFAVANSGAFQRSSQALPSRSRILASSVFGELRSASTVVEKRVALELAPPVKNRHLASVGRPANALENFRFGVLEGKYSIKMDGEKIRDVDFIDTPDSEGRPSSLGSRSEFFSKYGPLFGLRGAPQRVAVDVVNGKIVETYKISALGVPDTIIKVTLDDLDRLISLHSEKQATLKIF